MIINDKFIDDEIFGLYKYCSTRRDRPIVSHRQYYNYYNMFIYYKYIYVEIKKYEHISLSKDTKIYLICG